MTTLSTGWHGELSSRSDASLLRSSRRGVFSALRRSRGDSSGRLLGSMIGVVSLAVAFAIAESLRAGATLRLLGGDGSRVLLCALAGYLAILALAYYQRRFFPTEIASDGRRRLCTSGIYRISRNPAQVAFTLPILAIGIVSPAAVAPAILVYVLAMTNLVIRDEERAMRVTFGAAFEDYQRRTPRWIFG